MPNGTDNLRLEHRLTLASWFADKLGYDNPAEMLDRNKEARDTRDDDVSPVLGIVGSGRRLQIPAAELLEMDAAVRGDLASINRRRPQPISLKYFQYLAALSSEYFLRRRKESPEALERDLNKFAKDCYFYERRVLPQYAEPEHISKIAFWMATGAGKTLLMHLNYHQALRHLDFEPGNVVLVTPNADMTAQHLNELRASGIPCRRHDERGGALARGDAVCVLDIHKLSDKPGKKGDTVHPSYFVGPNLVFVDEGHKGAGGEDKGFFTKKSMLAEGGFSFEYSATFGQALSHIKHRAEEYGRAIAFDYSYRYFYNDFYGKDFFVLNTGAKDDNADNTDTMLLGNLLAFFQQRLAYDKYPAQAREFNIEAPLLLMLGASVTGGSDDRKKEADLNMQTDIVNIVRFLHRALAERKWLEEATAKITGGESGIQNANTGKDIFAGKFDLLNIEYKGDAEKLCKAMRKAVFNNADGGGLRFCPLKKTARKGGQGEIALRAGEGKPFALVYVGDSRKLRQLVEGGAKEVHVEEDFLQDSLFSSINDGGSPVNILIGAKKFMEGWSSWRVCGIGLLNVGKKEGPLIIQLFGRGVRLQGRGLSLKRNEGLPQEQQATGDKRQALKLMETLNIFAVRANFMSTFRDYLTREGVVLDTIELPVRETLGLNPPPLPVPEVPEAGKFDGFFRFAQCDGARLNVSSAIAVQEGMQDGAAAAAGVECEFDDEVCKRINFGDLYLRLLENKDAGGGGVTVVAGELKGALKKCKVRTDENDKLNNFPRPRLQKTALAVLRKSAANKRAKLFRKWQRDNVKAGELDIGNEDKHPNLKDYTYTLRLPGGEDELARRIKQLIDEGADLFTLGDDRQPLPRFYYERHLFQPLLEVGIGESKVKVSPPVLNQSERGFVSALKNYVRDNPLPEDAKVYLLRNLPYAGIGFALEDDTMYYPDFIMWTRRKKETRVVFVEPHGMRLAKSYRNDHKARLWTNLQNLNLGFAVDSYIVSATRYHDLYESYDSGDWSKEQFAAHHILFSEDLINARTNQAAFAALLGLPQH